MPVFYEFANWLTQNRAEAEDLGQETHANALKGFSSFQPSSTGAPGGTGFSATLFHPPHRVESESSQIQKDRAQSTMNSSAVFPPTLGSNHRRVGER
jgi:hypothetical protein